MNLSMKWFPNKEKNIFNKRVTDHCLTFKDSTFHDNIHKIVRRLPIYICIHAFMYMYWFCIFSKIFTKKSVAKYARYNM